jgi:hypothetical protein
METLACAKTIVGSPEKVLIALGTEREHRDSGRLDRGATPWRGDAVCVKESGCVKLTIGSQTDARHKSVKRQTIEQLEATRRSAHASLSGPLPLLTRSTAARIKPTTSSSAVSDRSRMGCNVMALRNRPLLSVLIASSSASGS